MQAFNQEIRINYSGVRQPGPYKVSILPLSMFDRPFGATNTDLIERIWPYPYAEFANDATASDWNTGDVFYISVEPTFTPELGSPNQVWIVGITGYFLDKENPDDVYLRWTGVLPMYQHSGIATKALRELIAQIKLKYPHHNNLIELVPDNTYGHTIPEPFFTKFGFVKTDAYVPPAESTDWPCLTYVYPLRMAWENDMLINENVSRSQNDYLY